MNKEQATDDLFAIAAAEAGGIKPLLDSFFGFMKRRTDFYVQFDANAGNAKTHKMGFPKGMAETMVMQSLHKYSFQDYNYSEDNQIDPKQLKNETIKKENKLSTAIESKPIQPILTSEGKQIPIGNGGVADNYYWTQSLEEATIYVALKEKTRRKDIICTIKPKSLLLSYQNGENLINGEIEGVVKTDESMWTFVSGQKDECPEIVITLGKTVKTWWKQVIIGHPEIDTSKVDSTKNINDYDSETQGTIRKLMFEQRQKMLGTTLVEKDETQELFDKYGIPPLPNST